MARKLTPSEFFEIMAQKNGISPLVFQQVYESTMDFIVNEMRMYGEIKLPNFLNITLTHFESKYRRVPIDISLENRGKTKLVWVEAYDKLNFVPTERFKQNVNDNYVTRAEIKKQRVIAEKDRKILAELEKQKGLRENALLQLEEIRKKKQEKYLLRQGKKVEKAKTDEELEDEEFGYNG
ncbi:MAG: hypothetical protein RSD67_02410 [Oscillospiraceae bacterium]